MSSSTSTLLKTSAAALLLCVLTGCPPANPGVDAGSPPPDPCNSVSDALGKPECAVPTTGAAFLDYVGTANDVDWFRIDLPAGLTQRDLIRVRGAYTAAQTAVNLTVGVLTVNPDGSAGAGIDRVIDRHGQGAPRPVELLFQAPGNPNHPTTGPTRLLIQVSDENANPSRPNFDDRQPYTLTVERLTDPDTNEPNETTPTLIPLDPGTATGRLSIEDDVDLFAVDVPAPTGPRNILHVQLTAPAPATGQPPPPFRLMFELRDPAGTPLSENILEAGAQAFAVDLATARLAPEGRYTITVKGYRRIDDPTPVPGDLNAIYTVRVRVLPEQDSNEPNDAQPQARVLDLGAAPGGAMQSRTGRLDHVPDPEWFRVDLGPLDEPSLLYYRLIPTGTGGRYAPLSQFPDRQVQVFSEVSRATREEATAACLSGEACPSGWTSPGAGLFVPLIQDLCENHDPPRCLQSLRAETTVNPGLNNFAGVIRVPAHTTSVSWYLVVQDLGNDWADDRDYVLQVQWRADPDEVARYSTGAEQPTAATMPFHSDPSGFPIPPAGAVSISGTLSHGHGLVSDADKLLDGQLIRGVEDYDAVATDVDRYVFTLPSQDPSAGPLDRTWELEWTVDHHDGGLPHELAVEVTFCDGDRLDGGVCTPVRTTQLGNRLVLAYSDEDVVSWHNNSGAVSSRQPAWERAVSSGSTTTTAAAYGCFCFEPRFVKGGTLTLDVVALDRIAYEPVTYTLRTSMTEYPRSYTSVSGAEVFCPAPDAGWIVLDGGLDGGETDGGIFFTPGCTFTTEP